MERAATMDNPAPDNDASVRSLGIFLLTRVNNMYTIKVLLKVQKKKKKKEAHRHSQTIHKIYIPCGSVRINKISNKSLQKFKS